MLRFGAQSRCLAAAGWVRKSRSHLVNANVEVVCSKLAAKESDPNRHRPAGNRRAEKSYEPSPLS